MHSHGGRGRMRLVENVRTLRSGCLMSWTLQSGGNSKDAIPSYRSTTGSRREGGQQSALT